MTTQQDETNTNQGNEPAGADITSPETDGTTPKFTKAQLDEQVKKATADSRTEMGRLKAESERLRKQSERTEQRITKILADQETAEMEAAKDKPDKVVILQERNARRKLEAELESERNARTVLEERQKVIDQEIAQSKRSQTVQEIATRLKVNPEKLARLSRYTDGSKEAIEEIAKEISPATPKPEGEDTTFHADSGRNRGGTGVLTAEQIEKMPIGEYAKHPSVKERYK
jgi:hypothetical protein